MGQWIDLTAADGFRMAAYRADPAGQGKPRGGLVVVQEVFVAPALFDRYERGFDIGYTPEDIARGREFKARAGTEAALSDIAAARDVATAAGRVGIVGYCWGGFITWMSATRLPGFACAIPYYGGGMLEAGSEQPKCAVMAHFGERDAAIPVAGARQLAAAHPEGQFFF
ncbi:MAG: dienelactone hydrolase family protein, partial [Betaproteobacteria bacterium]